MGKREDRKGITGQVRVDVLMMCISSFSEVIMQNGSLLLLAMVLSPELSVKPRNGKSFLYFPRSGSEDIPAG